MSNQNTKIVYSLKMFTELSKLGFNPVATSPNPFKQGFICWYYECTPDFVRAFDKLMEGTV